MVEKKKLSEKKGTNKRSNFIILAKNFLARRLHRSFRLTRRRDYIRPLKLPGYWSFTRSASKVLKDNRKLFLLMALVYVIITGLLVGIASQDTYNTLTNTLRNISGEVLEGDIGQVGEAAILFGTILSGGISESLTESQQTYATLIGLMTWLTTVWLLRNILAGRKVKLRDGLYNSGAPILSTFLVSLVVVIQLLPLAIALIAYAAAMSTGLLSSGVEAMLFWIAAGLLATLSVYWLTSTFMALIVATLPGMYPLRAIQTAGELVVGRRIRILLRMLWLMLGIVVTWAVIMIPIIIFDTWLKGVWSAIEWMPIVPVVMLVMSSLTIAWSSSYVYLLYRKIIDNDDSSN